MILYHYDVVRAKRIVAQGVAYANEPAEVQSRVQPRYKPTDIVVVLDFNGNPV